MDFSLSGGRESRASSDAAVDSDDDEIDVLGDETPSPTRTANIHVSRRAAGSPTGFHQITYRHHSVTLSHQPPQQPIQRAQHRWNEMAERRWWRRWCRPFAQEVEDRGTDSRVLRLRESYLYLIGFVVVQSKNLCLLREIVQFGAVWLFIFCFPIIFIYFSFVIVRRSELKEASNKTVENYLVKNNKWHFIVSSMFNKIGL